MGDVVYFKAESKEQQIGPSPSHPVNADGSPASGQQQPGHLEAIITELHLMELVSRKTRAGESGADLYFKQVNWPSQSDGEPPITFSVCDTTGQFSGLLKGEKVWAYRPQPKAGENPNPFKFRFGPGYAKMFPEDKKVS